ncbi:hypothetical protein GQ42DRAFT_154483 [Ramicandelaber brevisporus]|nr:hypothetical protein GQ42DRAFT_154483 [Ramicandelaber brevisporus]
MAKGGKRFIDKSKARTFTVVHRSQRDPLYADADAPQHVLAETGRGRNRSRRPANEYGDDDDDDEFEYGSGHYYGEDGEDDDELFDEADMKHMTLDDLEDDMDGDDLMEQIRGAETSLVEVPIAHKSALKEKGKSSAKKKLSIAYFDDEADKDGDEDEDEEEEEDGSNSKGGRRHVRFSLPSDVLPSKRENRSAAANQDDFPRGLMLDLDPEVRETLEKLSDDDCEEGELDDEFIKMLGEDNDEVVEEYRVRSGNVRVEPARSAYDYGEEDEEDDLADFRAWRNRGSRRRSSDDEYDSEDDGSMGSFGSDDREFDRRTVGSAFSMSSSNEEESPVNLGAARNRKETAEEKKARKQAVKAERRDRRADKKQLKAEHQILGMARKQVAAQRAADSIGKIN